VFHEADSTGIIYGNGSWSGMTEHVVSGIADIGVSTFYLTKERSEVVAYTDTLGFLRLDKLVYLLFCTIDLKLPFSERDVDVFRNVSFSSTNLFSGTRLR